MNTGVIDTSALVKFVLPEEHSDKVRRLIVLHQSSAVKLLASDYILVESANVLWKHARRNNLRIRTQSQVSRSSNRLKSNSFPGSASRRRIALCCRCQRRCVRRALCCLGYARDGSSHHRRRAAYPTFGER